MTTDTTPLPPAARALLAAGAIWLAGLVPAAAQQEIADETIVAATSRFTTETWEPWLDPSGETPIVNTIGETLLRGDPETGELVGGLAESWSVSDDLKVWSFKLRRDIPFHGGYGTVTAEDVKFSWEQYISEESTISLANAYRQAIDGDMDNFVITSPLEFELHTTRPVVYLAAAVSNTSNSNMKIQSKTYWETKPDEARRHPIGTGPFQFVRYDQGIEVELEVVENHWRQTPAFKRLIFKIIEDEAARLTQVASGDVDISPLNPRLLGEAEALGLQIFSAPDSGSVNILLGGMYPGIGDPALGETEEVRNHPLGEARYDRDAPWIQTDAPERGLAIRKALSLAIDRQAILDTIMSGRGTLLHAPWVQYPSNPQLTDPSWTVPPYDPEQARQLLAEGGYPDGFEITIPIFPWQDRIFTIDISEAVAGMWEDIGIKVNRLPTDYPYHVDKARNRTTAGMAYPAVAAYYAEQVQGISATLMPTSGNARLYDQRIIDAVAALNAEPDRAKRYAITRELLAYMRDEVISIPLFTYEAPFIATSRIGSWRPNVGNATMGNFEAMTLAE